MSLTQVRLALTAFVREGAMPELATLPLQRARVVSQGSDGRVTLQLVDRSGVLPDQLADGAVVGAVPLWSGVPGMSVDPTPGQECLLAFARADASDPVAFLGVPKGQPAHAPIAVRIDATSEVRLLGESAGVARVGAVTVPVALEPAVSSLITALQTFAGSISAAVTVAQVAAAGAALQTALAAITNVGATKLEAQ